MHKKCLWNFSLSRIFIVKEKGGVQDRNDTADDNAQKKGLPERAGPVENTGIEPVTF